MLRRHWTPALLLALLSASCVFDGAGLEEKRCLYSEDCPADQACIGGFCQTAPRKGGEEDNNPNNNPGNNSTSDLFCEDGTLRNACGGCEPLLGLPGTACGSCDSGEWTCTDSGSATCEGATAMSTFFLDADQDGFGSRTDSIQACAATGLYSANNNTDCDDDDDESRPDAAEVCDGRDNDCDDTADEGVKNACGGCATLPAQPGEDCGQDSSGTWACAGAEQLRCNSATLNACGGAAELSGEPGEDCGACGRLACEGPDRLSCQDPGANACTGCAALPQAPGGSCGSCGTRVCDGVDATRCDDPGQNACGGCTPLTGALPGSSCGSCGRVGCDGANATRCEDPGANACGGCAVLSGNPGDPCGPCGLDRLECSGEQLRCSGSTACTLDMIRVEPGTFTMGSPGGGGGEPGRPGGNKERQHQVTLTRPFLAGRYEITQAEWLRVQDALPTNALPSAYSTCLDCPVVNVSWDAAIAFANALSTRDGLRPCYEVTTTGSNTEKGVRWDTTCTGYRLPTEAEWEYLTRAGTTTAVYSGDIIIVNLDGCNIDASGNVYNIAWTCDDEVTTPQLRGGGADNLWGFYDSSGNVAEWTWDKHINDHPSSAQTDPNDGTFNNCPNSGADCMRTVRGGSWRDGADKVRSAARVGMDGRNPQPTVGLRLVRTLSP